MPIDWNRLKYLATDGPRTIWTYPTDTVAEDAAIMDVTLPRLPAHELVKAEAGIAIIFHGSGIKDLAYPVEKIRETLDAIADSVLEDD